MKPTLEQFMHLLTENIQGLDESTITPDTNYKDTDGWNSMNALLIMALLETEYEVSVNVEQMKKCTTVKELYNIIHF